MLDYSTNLEDIETKRQNAPQFSYRHFLDEKSPGEALASSKFYEILESAGLKNATENLADCRSHAWFVRHKDTGAVRVAAKQCRLRWCFNCSEARQQYITHAVGEWWNNVRWPKLLTLTIKHSRDPLDEQIRFLYKSFAKFRNRKYVKDRMKGGVWFFQVTYNQKSEEWHPHLHILCDSQFLDHAKLRELWYKVTKNSNVVHIRAVNNPDKALSHNARYAARPSSLLKIPEDLWPELFEAFHGRRICGCFGSAKKISLRPSKPEDADMWEHVGDFNKVHSLTGSDKNAKLIWQAWLQEKTIEKSVKVWDKPWNTDGDKKHIRPPPKWETFDWSPDHPKN